MNAREPRRVLYLGNQIGRGGPPDGGAPGSHQSRENSLSRSERHDLIIVGAGPAGMCAAMYAGRGMLDAVLLERGVPGGELLNTEWIDDYPGFEHVLGRELAAKMAAHAAKFGADIRQEHVEGISRRKDGLFEIATSNDVTYEAPAVILTAGGTPTKLEVPGELEYAGRGVSYCAVCDGAFFKGEILAVIGGGDAAVEEADYLTRYASKVYVVHRRDEFRASKVMAARALEHPKVDVVWNATVEAVIGDDAVTGVTLRDVTTGETRPFAADGVFVAIGHDPNTALFAGQLELDDAGYIQVAEPRTTTSVAGVFAAGDVTDRVYRQAVTAAGQGCKAAMDAERFLQEEAQGH